MRMCGIAIAAAALVVACGKKSEEKADEAPELADIDGAMAVPADAVAVIGMDVSELAASPLVERAVSQMFVRDPGLKEQIEGLTSACDLDPGQDVESALIALLPGQDDAATESILVARGDLSESAIAACVGKRLADGGGSTTSVPWEGRILYRAVATRGGRAVWMSFGSDQTAVIASSREALEASLGDGRKLPTNEALAALVERAGADATLWGAGQIDPAVGQGLVGATGGQVQAPAAVFGHLGLAAADGLDLLLGVEMASEEDATKLISIAKPQLAAASLMAQRHGLGPLVKRIESRGEGRTARFSLRLSAAELSEITSVIDKSEQPVENPSPESEPKGDPKNGQGDAASDDEAPIRK